MREASQALLAYTGRHMARLNRLVQASYLLDFTLDRLNVVAPLEVCLLVQPSRLRCLGRTLHATANCC